MSDYRTDDDVMSEIVAENTRLRARVKALEEAAHPLAAYATIAEAYSPALKDNDGMYEIKVPLHRLRAARAALETKP